MDKTAMLKEVPGDYGLTLAVTSAIKFIFRNPYESLLIVDQDAKIQFMDTQKDRTTLSLLFSGEAISF